LSAVKTSDDYIALLKAFYGYFKPVEEAISRYVTISVLPDIQQRRKADYLLKDLSSLNSPTTAIPLAGEIPAMTTVCEAMGALYVLEGSTLGGIGITRMLLKKEQLSLQADQVQFFNSYGEAVGKMWNAFLLALNGFTSDGNDIEAMVNTADETFLLFKNWLQKQLVHG
jgi:heme oxygenase (biliverdin-IX-beta and delta-forming)